MRNTVFVVGRHESLTIGLDLQLAAHLMVALAGKTRSGNHPPESLSSFRAY